MSRSVVNATKLFSRDIPLSADGELLRIRAEFVTRISSESLDVLQADGEFSSLEKDAMLKENQTRANRANNFINGVRKKGDEAWEKMLDDRDPTLFCSLPLSSARLIKRGKATYFCNDGLPLNCILP